MEIALKSFCLPVSNMEESVKFYSEIMGFVIEYQTEEWSELKLEGEISLALRLQGDSEEGVKYSGIGFKTEDCEKITEELKSKGAEIIKSCEKIKANNVDDSYVFLTQFKDPNGHIHFISQEVK